MKEKRWIRVLAVILVLIQLLCLTGCEELEEIVALFDKSNYATFYNEKDNTTVLDKEEILNYTSKYQEYNSTYFRDCLTGDDFYMYQTLLYAMENNFQNAIIYVENPEMDIFTARYALSLDSPFLEQNIEDEDTFYTYDDGAVGFCIVDFTEEAWDLKMKALDKAKEIVAGIPSELTEKTDRMKYLYDYVCENVAYVDYEDRSEANYLYDALCKGETICDGFSNMLMLLFKIEGVDCLEAMGDDVENPDDYTEEELEEMEGHTWVVVKDGDNYYNYDATFDADTDNELKDYELYFGFSDELISIQYFDLDAIRPKCTDTSRDNSVAHAVISDLTSKAEAKRIAELTDQRAKQGQLETLLIYEGTTEQNTVDSFADMYINQTKNIKTVNYYWTEYGGKTLIVFKVETV